MYCGTCEPIVDHARTDPTIEHRFEENVARCVARITQIACYKTNVIEVAWKPFKGI